ncbi:MAG: response regulator transcription factor [Verrucomicrobiota bacterium]
MNTHRPTPSPFSGDFAGGAVPQKSGLPAIVWTIEDNAAFRSSLTRVLNQLPGLTCPCSFSSCEEAFIKLKHFSAPDVILLDVGLPGIDGLTGIGRFKTLAPQTHVIILTVFDDHDKIFTAICAGASGYLLKGVHPEKIGESIQEVLNGGAPITSRIARSMLEMFAKMAAPAKDYGLTTREKEVLNLLVKGQTKKEIAAETSVSYHTIDSHFRNIYTKLQVHSQSGAVAKAVKENLFSKR